MPPKPLGRLIPSDWRHVRRYPFSAIAPRAPTRVERTLSLPAYRIKYDQRREGACVGFSASWLMSILNRRYYDARWLWNEAKKIDEWAHTNPGDNNGTSVRAAMEVLQALGHRRIFRGKTQPADPREGIDEFRWAVTVDEIRTAIAANTPVALGVNWYTNFDAPVRRNGRWWIGTDSLGTVRGGHAVCIYRASDRLEAVGIVNNWGKSTPLVLMPYTVLERLLNEQGEATLVTDRVDGSPRIRRLGARRRSGAGTSAATEDRARGPRSRRRVHP